MRDLINLIESVGLANRKPGTVFANPQGDQLIFQGVKFYPEGGGSYTADELTQALDQISKQLGIQSGSIQWTDRQGQTVAAPRGKKGGFGLAQFDTDAGQRVYLARHLQQVSPIPTENEMSNKLPGGFRLQTAVAKKEAAGYKPTDVLGNNLDNLSPADILQGIQARFGTDSDEARATEAFMRATSYPMRLPLGNMNFDAFTNYFCEMLQPMALVMGKPTGGEARKAEKDWLTQGGYKTCRISFGATKTGGLTDSTLINSAGQTLGLSSKAEKGAKASAKNLTDKIDEMKSDPNGQKILNKYAKDIELIRMVTSGSTPGVLDTAVHAKIITPQEAEQILKIRKLPPGSEVIGQKLLSKNLEKKYAGRKAKDPAAVIPFFHIRAVLANEVADWVNNNSNFGKVAAEILNWGAFIQMETYASQSGNEIVLKPFEVIYPSTAVTNVELSAGKTFYSTGSKGNFTFIILYNGATEVTEPDSAEADVAPAITEPQDLEALAQKRSNIKAAPEEPKKYGTPKTLGRKRQR